MRRPWLIAAAWPVLLVLYLSSVWTVTVVAKDNYDNDQQPVRLKVDLLQDAFIGSPSCIHSFSQIELLNTHSTDPIMIHSIQSTPEETVLVTGSSSKDGDDKPSVDGQRARNRWEDHAIPQQIHISKLSSGSLSLGPGQVAIVPVTFLPRYPDLDANDDRLRENGDDTKRGSLHNNKHQHDDNCMGKDCDVSWEGGKSPPPISPTSMADLVDMVGDERIFEAIDNKRVLTHTLDPSYRRRSNLDTSSFPEEDEFVVTTTIVIDTSRGVVKLPVTATSVRRNLYQLPDSIQFHHPRFQKGDSTCRVGDECANGRIVRNGNVNSGGTTTSLSRFFSMNEVIILDTVHAIDNRHQVSATRTDSTVKPKMGPGKECYDLYLSNPMPDRELKIIEAIISKPEYISVQFDPEKLEAPDLTLLVETGPSQAVRQWSQEGPLYLPPDSEQNYVLTLCTALSGEVDRDVDAETYLAEMNKWVDTGKQDRNLGFLQIRTDTETLFIELKHSEDDLPYVSLSNTSHAVKKAENDYFNQEQSTEGSVKSTMAAPSSSLLKSFPDSIELNMISTSSEPIRAQIGLQNKSPVPIRVMRVTAAIDSGQNPATKQEIELLGLNVNITTLSTNGGAGLEKDFGSLILPSAAYVDTALIFSCNVDPNPSVMDTGKQMFTFSGNLIVRGTMDTDLTYREWLDGALENPYRENHLTVEIPFSISLRNGRIEAIIEGSSHPYPQLFAARPWDNSGRAISHLFFPMHQYTALPGLEDVLPPPNFIGTNEIRHDLTILSNMLAPPSLSGAEVVDVDKPGDNESLCRRFNVSTMTARDDAELYHGFEEIGSLILRYQFGGSRQKSHGPDFEAYIPKRCTLKIHTSPTSSGSFNIPLLIFPGRLEVASDDLESKQHGHEAKSFPAKTVVGLADLIGWCKTTSIGRSFLDLLATKQSKKSKSGSKMLSTYIKSLLPPDSLIMKPKFRPILLKLGAIDHGEVAKTSLYFVNHNPIPLTVKVDVGEVEGSIIRLSREESIGEGNSLVDYLPAPDTNIIVKKGEFKDHPVDGLLTFLISDERAFDFVSRFSFRESISPHQPSIFGSDVLGSLYDWHSKATFHRSRLSGQSKLDSASLCRGRALPSDYNSGEISNNLSLSSPSGNGLIMSSDEKLTKPLVNCKSRDDPRSLLHEKGFRIPPGAKARFEVQVRAPPKAFLEDDISELLTSGLVVSTNLGDVMPIFITFEALQGQLQASNVQTLPSRDGGVEIGPPILQYANTTIIDVPLELSWDTRTTFCDDPWDKTMPVDIPSSSSEPKDDPEKPRLEALGFVKSDRRSVPLFLKSSFSRNVRLLKLESCSPWFRVVPTNHTRMSSTGGVLVGFLQAEVECSSGDIDSESLPSYYQCLLNLLSRRRIVQPEGCGLGLLDDSGLNARRMEAVRITLEQGIQELQKTTDSSKSKHGLEIDFNYSNPTVGVAHAKTGHVRDDGFVPGLDTHLRLLHALQVASKYGFDWVTSSVRATLEYDANSTLSRAKDGASVKQNLTLLVHDLSIRSIIRPPKLFHSKSVGNVVDFQPTAVGEVSRTFIPVHNPTGVPLRVRLSVASAWDVKDPLLENDPSISVENPKYAVPDPSPYVQSGKNTPPGNHTLRHAWWEGEGSFFIHDAYGDLIRCRHNITIRAGPGAIVSLINPSLHAQVGLLAGCSARCGIQGEKHQTVDINVAKSPIGASSAAGITLTGTLRSTSAQMNAVPGPEPIVLSGSTPVPGTGGPPAFAIPYAALDEIVVPPYGRGRLGPIYFRPSGPYRAIGCDLAKRSGAKPVGFAVDLCESRTFKSFLYLENSLTGLERVNLRGKAAWDQVVFRDPIPTDGGDAFGDIETRNGRSTLMFPGSGAAQEDELTTGTPFHGPIVKEAVLHNSGDSFVQIMSVGLTEACHDSNGVGSCSRGAFRLQGCRFPLSHDNNEQQQSNNILDGFLLLPGENRSFFVEYAPDCSRKEEFARIVVSYRGWTGNDSAFGHTMNSRFNRNAMPFRHKQELLLLAYKMPDAALVDCSPVDGMNKDLDRIPWSKTINQGISNESSSISSGGPGDKSIRLLTVQVCLVLNALLLLCFALRTRFYAMRGMLKKIPTYMAYSQPKGTSPKRNRSHWNAAFRCLARADPSSVELQSLSREQMRQIMIGLYSTKGSTPPAVMGNVNTFSRERRSLVSNPTRSRTGKNGGGGNERIRTLSDAIFHDTYVVNGQSIRSNFPAGLGWRIAVSRGILRENSPDSITLKSQTKDLLRQRESALFSHQDQQLHVVEDIHSYIDDKERHDKDIDKGKAKPPLLRDGAQDESLGVATDASKLAEHLSILSQSESEANDRPKARITSDWIEAGIKPTESKGGKRESKNASKRKGKNNGKSPTVEVKPSTQKETLHASDETKPNNMSHRNAKSEEVLNGKPTVENPGDYRQKVKSHRENELHIGEVSNNTENLLGKGEQTKHSSRVLEKREADTPERGANFGMADNNTQSDKPNGFANNKHLHDAEDKAHDSKLPMEDERDFIRPPPGLAPPPGFGGSPATAHNPPTSIDKINTDSVLDNAPSIQDILGPQIDTQADPVLGSTSLPFTTTSTSSSIMFSSVSSELGRSENHFNFGSSPPPSTGTPGPPDPSLAENVCLSLPTEQSSLPILNQESQNGFDVMDFLDSILNEGGPLEPDEPMGPSNSGDDLIGAARNPAPVLSNPWASEGKSRASAYGISFDDEDDASSSDGTDTPSEDLATQGHGGNIPFLTPAAILNAEADTNAEEENVHVAMAFYAELMDD